MSKKKYIVDNLTVEQSLFDFIENEVCEGLDISAKNMFQSLSDILSDLQDENTQLLKKRDSLQTQIDKWHIENNEIDPAAYKSFLKDIGYIVSEPPKFSIDVDRVDDEIANIAGPQLVVPITNERFVLNAVNSRWGSLFDSLYGTNVIPNRGSMTKSFAHNLQRVNRTAELACDFLDEVVPLKGASYRQISSRLRYTEALIFNLNNGEVATLVNPEQYIGVGDTGNILLKNNIDKQYTDIKGQKFTLPGTSMTLVRNVGLHMMTDLVKNSDGSPTPEGILDAMIISLISLHDLKSKSNSKKGSIYIVKPKLHGPEEVAFTVKLFSLVEKSLGLSENTLKIGLMDEERRTSVNLKACIKEAKNRIIFINTGFLDRTGDEIRTSMFAGAMRCKNLIKEEEWYDAYEKSNVNTALKCGFHKKAQIGKGMWPQPDLMREMLDTKINHLEAGANCSWVPSPTAATLHSTHYHLFNVFDCQKELLSTNLETNQKQLLAIPLLKSSEQLSEENLVSEINNNAQSILGYVVKWINQGIGCSKVQDINHVGLMEDRATLRISSQHMANWLHHKICTPEQLEQAFHDMAKIVDKQNQRDPLYTNMSPDYTSLAFQASLALVFEGIKQPNGYTEEILTRYRRKFLGLD